MENQQNQQERTISIQDLWHVFLKSFWMMVIVAIIAGGGFFAFQKITYDPMYSSQASVVVVREQEDSSSSASTVNDLNVASKVLPNFVYMATEDSMLDAVIEELTREGKLTSAMTAAQLRKHISINNPDGTQIVEVTVEAENAQLAKDLADRITQKTMQKMNIVFLGSESEGALVRLKDLGRLSTTPSNGVKLSTAVIVAFAAAVLTYGVLCLLALFDDAIRTKEDVAQHLNVSILGEIPDAAFVDTYARHGYGGYGYAYGHAYAQTGKKGESHE